MTKAKHTPGPWEVEYKVNVKSSKGDFVASCGCNGRDIDVSIANAKLIAVAPELLEALELMTGIADKYCKSPEIEEAKKLLKRAKA